MFAVSDEVSEVPLLAAAALDRAPSSLLDWELAERCRSVGEADRDAPWLAADFELGAGVAREAAQKNQEIA